LAAALASHIVEMLLFVNDTLILQTIILAGNSCIHNKLNLLFLLEFLFNRVVDAVEGLVLPDNILDLRKLI
jgi:hypothetical protein